MSVWTISSVARFTRTELVEVLNSDYIVTEDTINEAYKDFQNDDACIANGINICRRIFDKHFTEVENE